MKCSDFYYSHILNVAKFRYNLTFKQRKCKLMNERSISEIRCKSEIL